jgi:exonuclease VII large subunit
MQTLAHTDARWQRACDGGAQQRAGRLDVLADRLAQLDPQRVLSRGYALIETDTAKVVVTPSQLRVGQRLRVSLARGAADVVPGSVQERLPERDD